jgi:hypothetical protein
MLLTVLILLLVLWFLGYLRIPNFVVPDIPLFVVNNHTVTLLEVIIFVVIVWAVGILPTPLRQIGIALVVLWVLATLAIIPMAGLSSLLVIAIIVGLIAALLGLFAARREVY